MSHAFTYIDIKDWNEYTQRSGYYQPDAFSIEIKLPYEILDATMRSARSSRFVNRMGSSFSEENAFLEFIKQYATRPQADILDQMSGMYIDYGSQYSGSCINMNLKWGATYTSANIVVNMIVKAIMDNYDYIVEDVMTKREVFEEINVYGNLQNGDNISRIRLRILDAPEYDIPF